MMYGFLCYFLTVYLIFNSFSCTISSKEYGIASGDVQTEPEGIGFYLSSLLIQRDDISSTPFTFTLDELLGENRLEDFEDSPGMPILRMLYNEQLWVKKSWDSLLFQADKLKIKKMQCP